MQKKKHPMEEYIYKWKEMNYRIVNIFSLLDYFNLKVWQIRYALYIFYQVRPIINRISEYPVYPVKWRLCGVRTQGTRRNMWLDGWKNILYKPEPGYMQIGDCSTYVCTYLEPILDKFVIKLYTITLIYFI